MSSENLDVRLVSFFADSFRQSGIVTSQVSLCHIDRDSNSVKHVVIQTANRGAEVQKIKSCRKRPEASVNVNKHQNVEGGKSDLCEFNHGMIVGARLAGLSISGVLISRDFHIPVSGVFTQNGVKEKKFSASSGSADTLLMMRKV